MVRADPQSPGWAWMALRLKMPKRFTFGSGGRRLPAHPDLSLRDYKVTIFFRHPTLTPISLMSKWGSITPISYMEKIKAQRRALAEGHPAW